jgi:hypothetical protein
MATPVQSPDLSDRDVRSESQSRALIALAAFPYDLGSVNVSFTGRGGVEVSMHGAAAEEVAAMAGLLGVGPGPVPDLHASSVVHFAGSAYLSGGLSLVWYLAPPEPRPDVEHRQRQWDALTAALTTTPSG